MVLPETKVEHERNRQAIIAAINSGNSAEVVPPPYSKENEFSDKNKFVTLKLMSMNDWGYDAYKRPK